MLQHAPTDCTLCRRLYGNNYRRFPRNAGQDPGLDLILPEETKPCVPWLVLNACEHYYHAHCLARSNPEKYTNIDTRNPDGTHEFIHFDEYDCLDCAGTQPNNSTFHPDVDAGTAQDVISEYTNSFDVFDQAERFVERYNDRRLVMRQMVNIYTILDPLEYTISFIQERLHRLYFRATNYLSLIADDAIPEPGDPVPNMFLFKQNGQTLNRIPYNRFLYPITVEYDMERLRVKELNIRQLYQNTAYRENIRHLNLVVAEFKKYMAGEPNTVTELEQDESVRIMIHAPTDRTRPLCVLNRHGESKQFVVFDDFPITENTGSCSISGGTRKRKSRKTKLIRNR